MEYRPIGKTGMSASIIGLGAEHIDFQPFQTVDTVINTALDQGINIMDLFMPGQEVRENIGRALGKRRDKMLIQGHIGSTNVKEQYDKSRDLPTVKRYFEDLLRFLNTDYIDIGMLFYIDNEKDFSDVFETDFVRYAQDLKQKGLIRAIGASSHNPVTAKRIVETGIVDLVMFSINPAFDIAPVDVDILDYLYEDKRIDFKEKTDDSRAAFYRLCEQRGVAITVMKTLGAGKLLSTEQSPFLLPLTVPQCIHYALNRPAVVSALIGCANSEEVLKAVAYLDASSEERDYSTVIRDFQGDFKGRCMYCNHCLPCPANINIAAVHKFLDMTLLDNAHSSTSNSYLSLDHHASECTSCGSCEERCPFSVSVIDNMKKAASLLKPTTLP